MSKEGAALTIQAAINTLTRYSEENSYNGRCLENVKELLKNRMNSSSLKGAEELPNDIAQIIKDLPVATTINYASDSIACLYELLLKWQRMGFRNERKFVEFAGERQKLISDYPDVLKLTYIYNKKEKKYIAEPGQEINGRNKLHYGDGETQSKWFAIGTAVIEALIWVITIVLFYFGSKSSGIHALLSTTDNAFHYDRIAFFSTAAVALWVMFIALVFVLNNARVMKRGVVRIEGTEYSVAEIVAMKYSDHPVWLALSPLPAKIQRRTDIEYMVNINGGGEASMDDGDDNYVDKELYKKYKNEVEHITDESVPQDDRIDESISQVGLCNFVWRNKKKRSKAESNKNNGQ